MFIILLFFFGEEISMKDTGDQVFLCGFLKKRMKRETVSVKPVVAVFCVMVLLIGGISVEMLLFEVKKERGTVFRSDIT